MPNCASLLADTSTIRLSTSTCARRPSSLSITARNWRYWGSGALMMSELVVGSAWICPPVEGWLLLVLLLPAPAPRAVPEPRPAELLLVPLPSIDVLVMPVVVLGVDEPLPPVLVVAAPLALDMAARRVVASLVASAFFRYTTWMLPVDALLPGAGGWSSFSTSERTMATRAGLAARRISELLRGSASSVVLKALSVCPCTAVGAAPLLPPSIRRDTSGTKSAAIALRSGITSTSVALDTSMAATMRARRCRLSA